MLTSDLPGSQDTGCWGYTAAEFSLSNGGLWFVLMLPFSLGFFYSLPCPKLKENQRSYLKLFIIHGLKTIDSALLRCWTVRQTRRTEDKTSVLPPLYFLFFPSWESYNFGPGKNWERWFTSVVLGILEIFWRHSGARGCWSSSKTVLSFPVLSTGLVWEKSTCMSTWAWNVTSLF